MKLRELHGQSALRGVASLIVFLAHATYYKLFPGYPIVERFYHVFFWSNQAVDIFFELSGFILCYVYMLKKFRWGDYFLARFSRIYPLYFAGLIFVLAIWLYDLKAGRGPGSYSPFVIFSNLVLIQDWPLVPYARSINYPTWSISVEVFLYIFIFPALCYLDKFLNSRQKFALIVAPVVGYTLMLFIMGTKEAFWGPLLTFRGIVCFTSGFFTCSMGLRIKFRNVISKKIELIFLLVTVACLFLQFPFERNAVTLCIPLLVYLAAQDTSLLTRALAGKVFNWLGDISYSIYVWHWPVLFVLARGLAGARNLRIVQVAHLDSPFFYIITTFGLVLLLAHCSHYYFERPVSTWLRKKRLFAVAPTMA